MSRYDASQFPISIWPGGRIDEPLVFHGSLVDAGDGVFAVEPLPPRKVQPELYLRGLLDLDTEDATQVMAFVAEHGIALAPEGVLKLRALGPVPKTVRTATISAFSSESPAWTLRHVQRLVRHWLAHEEGADVREVWELPPDTATSVPWARWAMVLNEYLRVFHVRVEVRLEDRDGEVVGQPWPTLDEVLALQLAKSVGEGFSTRRCQSETCGRPFKRQLDGAQHGQHRTVGVIYCSTLCARAQANREYRRRRKEKR